MVGLPPETAAALLRHSARHIATSMIHGDYTERDRAYDMAQDLEPEAPGFVEYVKRCIAEAGRDPRTVWVFPAERPEEAAARLADGAELRFELAKHIAGAYVSGSDDQVQRAKELETALDHKGVNVDNQVDRLVMDQMRLRPSSRGTGGRADGCPF